MGMTLQASQTRVSMTLHRNDNMRTADHAACSAISSI
jgi:hypothetical protein